MSCGCGLIFDSPLKWWAHYAWECPLTEAGRSWAAVPVHGGKCSTTGLGDDFAKKIRQYLHLPWVRTALLPEAAGRDEGPALPAIIQWKTRPEDGAFLTSECHGDDSCTRGNSPRAGWAVGEVFRDLRGRIRTGRHVSGTLPGHAQTAEGAAAFTLLTWLRHLDPASPSRPRLCLDCQRVVDGWHRAWHTLAPWTPHRDIWLAIEAIRQDVRDDVEVVWVPSHASRRGAELQAPP